LLASLTNRAEPTYKSGIAVQTSGATSLIMPTFNPEAFKTLLSNTFNAIANDQAVVELLKSDNALDQWVNTVNATGQLMSTGPLTWVSPLSVGIAVARRSSLRSECFKLRKTDLLRVFGTLDLIANRKCF
jgi:hypothetical protein